MIAEAIGGHLELVAEGFSFPTSLTFDESGTAYIAEAGLPFGGAPPGGRVWKIGQDGQRSLLAQDLRQPVNGLTFYSGSLYLSEGGYPGGSGRISRLDLEGRQTVILDNLPGPGNYHTNMVAFGPDGKLYFSQGAMTNTGYVGLDAYELGWLRLLPHAHDLPGYEIELTGVNLETANPLGNEVGARTHTGAFAPFGKSTGPGQRIPAQLPCTASIMRCNPDGSDLELVAWGLRNAYGLGFLPDGRLLAVDQGADDRGSRPVGNVPDLLFEVRQGAWYGWPDFIGGDPITDAQYRPVRGPVPVFALANHAELPPPEKALLRFPPHTAAVKFDVAPPSLPRWRAQIFVALFGDEVPMTAPSGPHAGRSVARIDPEDWSLHTVLEGPLARPIDVRFQASDSAPMRPSPIQPDALHASNAQAGRKENALYILDFGNFEMHAERGVIAEANTGKLWRLQWA